MKPKLAIVTAPPPELPLETRLRKALCEERRIEQRLSKLRLEIGSLKRAYQEKHKTFGLSNQALLHRLSHKD